MYLAPDLVQFFNREAMLAEEVGSEIPVGLVEFTFPVPIRGGHNYGGSHRNIDACRQMIYRGVHRGYEVQCVQPVGGVVVVGLGDRST
jgi:hypothetical protein